MTTTIRTGARERLALSLLTEPGDPRLHEMLATHRPRDVLAAVRGEHRLPGLAVPRRWADAAPSLEHDVDAALERAAAAGVRWLVPGSAGWPGQIGDLDHLELLQDTAGAPLGLWVRGEARLADLTAESLAVVGARSCSSYGAEVAADLGADLSSAGFTVVSGAAYGIDACAHRGALTTGRPTVAVLACGADRAYPQAHATLLDRIVGEGGLVVSEQAPGAEPLRHRFLSRNRLIAALSLGTVVVEAELRSGSLNTLHWADLLGRSTMAMPGPVTSRRSDGAHSALRSGKAVLVTDGRDVIEEVTGVRPGSG